MSNHDATGKLFSPCFTSYSFLSLNLAPPLYLQRIPRDMLSLPLRAGKLNLMTDILAEFLQKGNASEAHYRMKESEVPFLNFQ